MSNNTPVLRGTWNFPTTIWFGAGKIAMLSRACRHLGITRPLFVTDPTLSETEMVKTAIAQAEADGIAPILFSGIKPNPVGANIDAGVDALLAAGCDGVIALGGGSSLDAGKTIALAAAQPAGGIPFWNLEEGRDDWRRAIPPLKIVAIPTTAGTGSETGRSTVVVNESTRRKVIITHPGMMPGIVIADPELTLSLPADITAATGMDALVHCLEAYCSPFANPMCDGVALEGLRLIHESLSVAVSDGSNLSARAKMLAAAAMGSTAFQKGLGAIHAMSHPVGALYNTHHGLTNAVIIPYVLVRNRAAIEDKLARVSAYLGLGDGSRAGFDAFLAWCLELRATFEIPNTLADLGVETERFEELAKMAAQDPTALANPLALDKADFHDLFKAAHAGLIS